MTRFFMQTGHAVELILKSLAMAQGGETFVFKMPVLQVGDLARAMIESSRTQVEQVTTGLRPGEKMYEELMSEEESSRAIETQDMFIILPFYQSVSAGLGNYADARQAPMGVYSSSNEELLSLDDIKEMLHGLDLE
jgi:FlaA1/EpsC-like NDP-sugar epimerase